MLVDAIPGITRYFMAFEIPLRLDPARLDDLDEGIRIHINDVRIAEALGSTAERVYVNSGGWIYVAQLTPELQPPIFASTSLQIDVSVLDLTLLLMADVASDITGVINPPQWVRALPGFAGPAEEEDIEVLGRLRGRLLRHIAEVARNDDLDETTRTFAAAILKSELEAIRDSSNQASGSGQVAP